MTAQHGGEASDQRGETARSAQSRWGFGLVRRSTATSWRRTSSSTSWRFDRKHSGGGKLTDLSAHAVDALESIVGEVEHVESATFRDVRRVG